MPATTNITDPFGAGSAAYNLAGNNANSNLAASGSMIQLSDIINATNRAAQTAANNTRLGPQGVATQNNLLTNAQKESAGLLDPQTEQMLQQGIAAGGNASGMGVDSANLAASYRRALGQTINSTEQQGQTNYLDLLAANPSAPIYDMSGQLVTPATYASTAAANMPAATTGATGGGGSIGGGNPLTPTAAQSNTVPYGGGYAGIATTPSGLAPGIPIATTPSGLAPGIPSDYNAGGSSVFGTTSNGYDMFDPSGLFSGYGSMPNYSTSGADPIAAALGIGTSGGGLTLNPNTGIYDYGSGYTGSYGGDTGTTGNLGDLGFGDYYGGG